MHIILSQEGACFQVGKLNGTVRQDCEMLMEFRELLGEMGF